MSRQQSAARLVLAKQRPESALEKTVELLLSRQYPPGYWLFELEADATIPAEYVFLQRILERPLEDGFKERLRNYLLSKQQPDGGWPLYEVDGMANLSVSVKAYMALKILGESKDAPHMVRARQMILNLGGGAKVNVFARIMLAMLGQIPWRTAPAMPVEMMLLPRWFFFHLSKVSYWSRTVIVPLLILYAAKPVCRLSPSEGVPELFTEPPEELGTLDFFKMCPFVKSRWRKNFFILMDRVLKRLERYIPGFLRRVALRRAEQWTLDHMQGSGGIGAIFPAMANALMALKVLGYPEDHPAWRNGLQAIDDLVAHRFTPDDRERRFDPTIVSDSGDSTAPEAVLHSCKVVAGDGPQSIVQPCVSPVWDTCLTLTALLEAGVSTSHSCIRNAVDWLFDKQIFVKGDWADRAPGLEPAAWAFQFENTQYPDLDDTCSVVMALMRAGVHLESPAYRERLERAVRWVIGMQNRDGGWGAFDVDNNALYLNDIPFADHGALLDPSTPDVTGRALEMLGMTGYRTDHPAVVRALNYMRNAQETTGPWFGRWGVNYVYGTWSVLQGLQMVGADMASDEVRRAVEWIKSRQNPDGGWGETCYSYFKPDLAGMGDSTPSQTSWALLGLMAAGEAFSREAMLGVRFLLDRQEEDGGWPEAHYTGTGFPRMFYLRYHGYSRYFPLWALAVYQRLWDGDTSLQEAVSRSLPAFGRCLKTPPGNGR